VAAPISADSSVMSKSLSTAPSSRWIFARRTTFLSLHRTVETDRAERLHRVRLHE
jgi:hypothetical protein